MHIATRDMEKAKNLSKSLGSLAQPMEIAAAMQEADIIILSVRFEAIKALMRQYALELQGKIIIDPSNPIAADANGGFVKTIGARESAGLLHAAFLPKHAKLVKALGTLCATSIANTAGQKPKPAVLFHATDDTRIREEIEALIQDIGFEPLRIGGIDQSIRIEIFGDLHEFGPLGKTVTMAEAGKKAYHITTK